MHHRYRATLVQQQQRLLLRSADLRGTLAHQAQALKSPLSLLDRLRSGARWLGRHPAWPTAALALLSLYRPLRLLRWVLPLIGSSQLLRRRSGRHGPSQP